MSYRVQNALVFKPFTTIDDFLKQYEDIINLDFQNIFYLNFKLNKNRFSQRISPIIELATLEDVKEITQIFKEVYEGTYPFKQMENVQEVRKMIKSSNYHWFLFKLNSNKIVGCFGVRLEFEKKIGLFFGFIIKKKYHKKIDIMKLFIACALFVWKAYKNKIFVWYSELRTHNSGPQFVTSQCGLKPIAFLPNKDIFFDCVESEIMHVIHNEKALYKYRSKEVPKIIRQVLNCYVYSNKRYHLGIPKIENPKNSFDSFKITTTKRNLFQKEKSDKFGNKTITFFLKNSDSYLTFLYNPLVRNIEKTTYNVVNLEELFVFVQKLKSTIEKLNIRYAECFVSSYKPTHQKIFLEMNFKPRGYVPCWKYNKKQNNYEDNIVFNYFKGNLDRNMKIIPEALELLKALNMNRKEDLVLYNTQ